MQREGARRGTGGCWRAGRKASEDLPAAGARQTSSWGTGVGDEVGGDLLHRERAVCGTGGPWRAWSEASDGVAAADSFWMGFVQYARGW